jgi:hypothetical protein
MYCIGNIPLITDMIEKVRVPRKVYQELVMINREIHYPNDYPLAIKKAENNGFIHAAEWLRNNEELYKRGFARGFEPAD